MQQLFIQFYVKIFCALRPSVLLIRHRLFSQCTSPRFLPVPAVPLVAADSEPSKSIF